MWITPLGEIGARNNELQQTKSYTLPKIVSLVATTPITSSHNGSNGYSVISALAIADCIDGVHDLGSGTGSGTQIVGGDWSGTNTTLRAWAGEAGKSALPYLGDDAGSSGKDDYETACSPGTGDDPTLGCGSGSNYFYLNRKACTATDVNYCWAAACATASGGAWSTGGRLLGDITCSHQDYNLTSLGGDNMSFRVVVRP